MVMVKCALVRFTLGTDLGAIHVILLLQHAECQSYEVMKTST